MLYVLLKTGERVAIVKSLTLAAGYFLMHVKDQDGERVQVFSSEEIEDIVSDPDDEAKAA